MANIRESMRVKNLNQRLILDNVARQRRAKKALESLEQDNFHEDPHSNVVPQQKMPKFEKNLGNTRSYKKLKPESLKIRPRKNLAILLEEENNDITEGKRNYQAACVPPSKFPDRHFCSVCGFPSNYTCVQCGIKYCCIKCLKVHQDTRCLKWTA